MYLEVCYLLSITSLPSILTLQNDEQSFTVPLQRYFIAHTFSLDEFFSHSNDISIII